MARYDKCWYLGTNPESEGEQLGETLFRFWESGQISDRNADKLLQTVVVTCGSTEDSRAEAVLRIFENYGVYSDDPVFLTIDLDAGEDPAAMISAQLMLSGSTDLVLIADPSLAPGVAASCASAGVPAAAFGEPDGTAELLSAGSLLAYSRFDTPERRCPRGGICRECLAWPGRHRRQPGSVWTKFAARCCRLRSSPLPSQAPRSRPQRQRTVHSCNPLVKEAPMVKNEILEMEITALSNDGNGVGHIDGCAVFVPFTAPGDRARVRIAKVQKNYAFGILTELIAPGPDRIEPDCPAFGRCGGCALRHLRYSAELAAKTQFVQDAFDRIGGFSLRAEPCLPSPDVDRYRNKVQYPLCVDANGEVRAGFFAPRSHRVIPCPDCLLQPALLNEISAFLCRFFTEKKISVYDERTGRGSCVIFICVTQRRAARSWSALLQTAESSPLRRRWSSGCARHFPQCRRLF